MLNPFEEVKKNLSFQKVAEYYRIEILHKNKALCPFHLEKTASLHLRSDKFFCCYSCGARGSIIDFTMKLFDLTPLEATKKLDEDFHLNIFNKKLTNQQKLEIREKINKEKECELIIEDFEANIEKEEKWFLTVFRNLRWMIKNLPPRRGEDPSQIWVLAIHNVEYVEEILKILQSRNFKEKTENYNIIKNYKKKLNKKILEIVEGEEEYDSKGRIC